MCDPTTGEIRNSCVDIIACSFIDANHNPESSFIRDAEGAGTDSTKSWTPKQANVRGDRMQFEIAAVNFLKNKP